MCNKPIALDKPRPHIDIYLEFLSHLTKFSPQERVEIFDACANYANLDEILDRANKRKNKAHSQVRK